MISWDKPDRLSEYDPSHAACREVMSYRVREVLLVSSLYDSNILEEDGQLSESLDAELYQINLATSPRITQVSSADEALGLPDKRPFDLVMTMARPGGMDARNFARMIKEAHADLPAVLLAKNHFEAHRMKELNHPAILDQVFVWRGDVALFVAFIRFVEDRRNVRLERPLDVRIDGRSGRGLVLRETSLR